MLGWEKVMGMCPEMGAKSKANLGGRDGRDLKSQISDATNRSPVRQTKPICGVSEPGMGAGRKDKANWGEAAADFVFPWARPGWTRIGEEGAGFYLGSLGSRRRGNDKGRWSEGAECGRMRGGATAIGG